VQPPLQPFTPSLRAQGLSTENLLCIHADRHRARMWATEQSLRCADVVCVLGWLPEARSAELRRLQIAAHEHDKLLFVFRGTQVAQEASPARLRLRVEGLDSLQLRILKRRGPPLERDLQLPGQAMRLQQLLASRQGKAPSPTPQPTRRSHVLDRTAAFT
jgi:protein ImuA